MNYLKTYEQNSDPIKDIIETNLIAFTDNGWRLETISPQQLNNFSWKCQMVRYDNISKFSTVKDDIIECVKRFDCEYISFSFIINRKPIFDIYKIDTGIGYRYVEFIAPYDMEKEFNFGGVTLTDGTTIVYATISIILEIE